MIPTVKGGEVNSLDLLQAAAEVYLSGGALDFAGIFAGGDYAKVALPTYPFERRRYWITDVAQYLSRDAQES